MLKHSKKMKFSMRNFFSKCEQIRSFLRIWSNILKKSLMENFIFCRVKEALREAKMTHEMRFSLTFSKKNKGQWMEKKWHSPRCEPFPLVQFLAKVV